MHKLPIFTTWSVGSSSCERSPKGSRLECDALTVRIGFTIAEDGTVKGEREFDFKIGGEPPTEPGVGHIAGEAADALLKLNATLVASVAKSAGLVFHKDLPEELKQSVPDPSVPVMPVEMAEGLRRLEEIKAEQGAKVAAREAGDPNWMYAKPDIKKFKPVKKEPAYIKDGLEILDPLPKTLFEKFKQYLPWILL